MGVPGRSLRAVVAVSALATVASACTVSPPPAPQSTDTSQSSTPPPPRATQIIIGIDSIDAGSTRICSLTVAGNAAIGPLVSAKCLPAVPDPRRRPARGGNRLHAAGVERRDWPEPVHRHLQEFRPKHINDNAPIAADDFWFSVAADRQPARCW